MAVRKTQQDDTHEQKLTLEVDVYIPGHEERTTTSLFKRTRRMLIESKEGRCYICGRNAPESGHPLEAHHHPIERSMANAVDWERVKADFPSFDWSKFDPKNPYTFVDDMRFNGMLLCKDHHTGKNEGIHFMPFPLWVIQRYLQEGYRYTPSDIIIHAEDGIPDHVLQQLNELKK